MTRGFSGGLWRLVMTEMKLYVRERVGPIWGVAFPLLLLVIFGSIPLFREPDPDLGGRTQLDVHLPVLVGFVITMLAFVALPLVLAGYREKGVLRRLRTTPVGPARLLAAQLAVNAAVAAVTAVLLVVVARLGYGVALPRQLGGFAVTTLLTTAALLSIGLFIAAVAPSARAAQGIGTLLFFPVMFFGGLWLPIAEMPAVLRDMSHATPLGTAVQALLDSAQGSWPQAPQVTTLAAYGVAFGLAAARLFRWE